MSNVVSQQKCLGHEGEQNKMVYNREQNTANRLTPSRQHTHVWTNTISVNNVFPEVRPAPLSQLNYKDANIARFWWVDLPQNRNAASLPRGWISVSDQPAPRCRIRGACQFASPLVSANLSADNITRSLHGHDDTCQRLHHRRSKLRSSPPK